MKKCNNSKYRYSKKQDTADECRTSLYQGVMRTYIDIEKVINFIHILFYRKNVRGVLIYRYVKIFTPMKTAPKKTSDDINTSAVTTLGEQS